jgi:glycosyltransferase involved in cell wall biosynthesis
MSKKKIVVLTPGSYIDTDITIVKHLQQEYEVAWYIVQKIGEEKFTESSLRDFLKGSGVELHYHAHTCRFRSSEYRKMMFQYMGEFVKMGAHLIYTAHQDFYFFLAYVLKGRKIPLVMGIHDVEPHSSANRPTGTAMVHRLNRMIGKEYVLFSKNQYELFCRKFPRLKATFVGMSAKDFGTAAPQEHFREGVRRLAFFGTLNAYKGTDLLIQAFEELIEEGVTNLRLAVYGRFGDKAFGEQCMQLIRHPEYYDLHVGFVDNKDIPAVFTAHDVMVFPYRDATQSGPLMINVNYGLPIVAPNHTCFADIYTDAQNAFLYKDSMDCNSLKGALRRVAEVTREDYEEMLKQCNGLKEMYSEEAIAKNYYHVFNRWMA